MSGLIQKNNGQDNTLEIISDNEVRLILESVRDLPKSANQIIIECNIAQSTLYRKLKRLVEFNILRIKHVMGECGRWEMRYQSNLCLVNSIYPVTRHNNSYQTSWCAEKELSLNIFILKNYDKWPNILL